MKNKKKLIIVLGIICMITIVSCVAIQIFLKEEDKKLQQESKKYKTMMIKTKSGEVITTEYTHFDHGKFYLKIPKNFQRLDDQTIMQKYNGNVPNIVYSNKETTINIAISLTDNQMKDTQIKEYQKYMVDLLKENNELIDNQYYEIDGHHIGQIRLFSKAVDMDIYNNMIFFSDNDKLVIITFNCPKNLKNEWNDVADFIINSLFFKE